jgi:hypothetical protein
MWLSKFRTYMTLLHNYAGRMQKSSKITKMRLFARQGETKHREYKRLKLGGGQAYNRSSG